MGAFCVCASSTRRTICAYLLSALRLLARISRTPSRLTLPESTSIPGALRTGTGSPVRSASLMLAEPEVTTPSTGTSSPGLTTTSMPTSTWSAGMLTRSSPCQICATRGARSASAEREARSPESIRSQCLAARQHHHDKCACQVLPQDDRPRNRQESDHIDPKFLVEDLLRGFPKQRDAAQQHHRKQRPIRKSPVADKPEH